MKSMLAPQELARLKRLRAVAKLFDASLVIPGINFRFGLDAILGLFPVAGDIVTSMVSLYIINEAAKMGAPKDLLVRMLLNLGIDFLAGSIPLAGDLFDAVWKANMKNLDLLEKYMKNKPPGEDEKPIIDV